jgi:hypothetical protein
MMRFHSRFPEAAFCAAALFLVVGAPTCADSDGTCTAEPVGAITAYLLTAAPAAHLDVEGPVVSLSPVDANGIQEMVIRDASTGGLDTLRYGVWGHPDRFVALPVTPGRSYRVTLDHVGGFPEASGILIQDERGVLFAAASDRGPGELALTGGVPGFGIALEPTDCVSRSTDECFTYLRNMRLRVTRAEASAALIHGEEASLAGYRVVCLTAQEAGYTNACADAGVVNLSYVIARADSTN